MEQISIRKWQEITIIWGNVEKICRKVKIKNKKSNNLISQAFLQTTELLSIIIFVKLMKKQYLIKLEARYLV